MQLFCDMDGVLADFDAGYERQFGVKPDGENVDWEAVRRTPDFYLNLPPMPDMPVLWGFIRNFRPIILTGIPHSVEEAPANKKAWVKHYLGEATVICCRSRDKSLYANPGDILIDDRPKYKELWERAGGIWITHTSAQNSIKELVECLT